jgi:hypothetical protein
MNEIEKKRLLPQHNNISKNNFNLLGYVIVVNILFDHIAFGLARQNKISKLFNSVYFFFLLHFALTTLVFLRPQTS